MAEHASRDGRVVQPTPTMHVRRLSTRPHSTSIAGGSGGASAMPTGSDRFIAEAKHTSSPNTRKPSLSPSPAPTQPSVAAPVTLSSPKHPRFSPARRSFFSQPISRWCCPCYKGKRRLSFALVMTILVVVQVLLSCALIWMLGYLSTLDTVEQLASTIRQSIIRDVSHTLNMAMAQPLHAAYDISALTSLHFPDLENQTSIMNEDGWLASLSYVAMRYPTLSRVGFATRNDLYVLITSGASPDDAQQRFSSELNLTVSISLPVPLPQYASVLNQSDGTTLLNFRPKPIHPPSLNRPPFALQPEILYTDTGEAIERYLGPPIAPVYNFSVAQRPFYQAAADVYQAGDDAGWSNVYPSSNINYPGTSFLAIAAVHAQSATDGSLGYASFAVINLDNLNALLTGLPLGPNGFGYFIRANGGVVSSSVPTINQRIRDENAELDLFDSDDPWLIKLKPLLLEWGLITRMHVTPRNSSLIVPYRPDQWEGSVKHDGSEYHVQAVMLDNSTSGLPLAAVLVTKDADFQGGVARNNINTLWLSALVTLIAIIVSFMVTRCVSRPFMTIVRHMDRACECIEMERSEKQRKELSQLCEEWSQTSGMTLPPLLTSAQFVSMRIEEDPRAIESGRFFCCGGCCDRQVGCIACGGLGRSLREVESMNRAFGSMLYSLASYDELEAINLAKRKFIRVRYRIPNNDARQHWKKGRGCVGWGTVLSLCCNDLFLTLSLGVLRPFCSFFSLLTVHFP